MPSWLWKQQERHEKERVDGGEPLKWRVDVGNTAAELRCVGCDLWGGRVGGWFLAWLQQAAHPTACLLPWALCFTQAQLGSGWGPLEQRGGLCELERLVKPRWEIAAESGIYLVGLHAAFDNASGVGFCTGLGVFFTRRSVTFFLCGGLLFVFLMQQQGRKTAF